MTTTEQRQAARPYVHNLRLDAADAKDWDLRDLCDDALYEDRPSAWELVMALLGSGKGVG